jgi:hypothetical protein
MASCRKFLAFKHLRQLCWWSIHKKTPIFILTTEDGTEFLPISSACYLLGKARTALNSAHGYTTSDRELLDILQNAANVPGGIKRSTHFISRTEFLRFIVDTGLQSSAEAEAFVDAVFAPYAKRSRPPIVVTVESSAASSASASASASASERASEADNNILQLAREAYLESSKWKRAKQEIEAKVTAEQEEAELKAKIRACIESAEFDAWVAEQKSAHEAQCKKRRVGK